MGANTNIPGVETGGGNPVPTSYICEVTPTYDPEDNETWAGKAEFAVVDCPPVPLNGIEDMWNCNLCGNDERYEQPVIDGDIVLMQFKINDPSILRYQPFLFDAAGNILEHGDDEAVTMFVTEDAHGNTYLNIKLTISEIPADCFYMRLYTFTCAFDAEDLADLRETNIIDGMGLQEAYLAALLELCPEGNEVYFTDMYRKTTAECEETILVEGEYGDGHDCAGNFYGEDDSGNRFVMRVRIPGSIEQTEAQIEETEVNNTRRTAKLSEVWRLKSYKIPPGEAAKVYIALAAKTFTVDALAFKNPSSVAKNNEEGRMWILDVTMNRECDEIDFACNS